MARQAARKLPRGWPFGRKKGRKARGGSTKAEEGPTLLTVQRQAEALAMAGLAGVTVTAGGALAALLAAGYLTKDQAATGELLAIHWRRWRMAYGVPRSSPRATLPADGGTSGRAGDWDEDALAALAATDVAVTAAVSRLPRAALPLLIAVCVDDDFRCGRSAAPLLGLALDAAATVLSRRR